MRSRSSPTRAAKVTRHEEADTRPFFSRRRLHRRDLLVARRKKLKDGQRRKHHSAVDRVRRHLRRVGRPRRARRRRPDLDRAHPRAAGARARARGGRGVVGVGAGPAEAVRGEGHQRALHRRRAARGGQHRLDDGDGARDRGRPAAARGARRLRDGRAARRRAVGGARRADQRHGELAAAAQQVAADRGGARRRPQRVRPVPGQLDEGRREGAEGVAEGQVQGGGQAGRRRRLRRRLDLRHPPAGARRLPRARGHEERARPHDVRGPHPRVPGGRGVRRRLRLARRRAQVRRDLEVRQARVQRVARRVLRDGAPRGRRRAAGATAAQFLGAILPFAAQFRGSRARAPPPRRSCARW